MFYNIIMSNTNPNSTISLEDFIEKLVGVGIQQVDIRARSYVGDYFIIARGVRTNSTLSTIRSIEEKYSSFVCGGDEYGFFTEATPHVDPYGNRWVYNGDSPIRLAPMLFQDMINNGHEHNRYPDSEYNTVIAFNHTKDDYYARLFETGDTLVVDDYYECTCQKFDRKTLCPHLTREFDEPDYGEITVKERPFGRGSEANPDDVVWKYKTQITLNRMLEGD